MNYSRWRLSETTIAIHKKAVEHSMNFHPTECIPLTRMALDRGEEFWEAWAYFCKHGGAFVSEVTPRSFEQGYAEWVKLSGPPDLRWK